MNPEGESFLLVPVFCGAVFFGLITVLASRVIYLRLGFKARCGRVQDTALQPHVRIDDAKWLTRHLGYLPQFTNSRQMAFDLMRLLLDENAELRAEIAKARKIAETGWNQAPGFRDPPEDLTEREWQEDERRRRTAATCALAEARSEVEFLNQINVDDRSTDYARGVYGRFAAAESSSMWASRPHHLAPEGIRLVISGVVWPDDLRPVSPICPRWQRAWERLDHLQRNE
jgi:hypothetical protein